MVEKLKTKLAGSRFVIFNDTRILGLLAFGIIAILVSWSSVKTIQTNYELQKQIAAQEQKNNVTKLENQNQKLRNEYFKTEQFLELAARRQFGKAAPGETVYVIPKKVALKNSIELSVAKDENNKVITKKPKYQQNLEAWLDFYLYRNKN